MHTISNTEALDDRRRNGLTCSDVIKKSWTKLKIWWSPWLCWSPTGESTPWFSSQWWCQI